MIIGKREKLFRSLKNVSVAIILLTVITSCKKGNNEQLETQTKMKLNSSLTVAKKAYFFDEGEKETVEQTFISEDGLCKIQKMQSYYDVTLNYEKGNPEQVGKAYAKVIRQAAPDFEIVMEPYLYENIRLALSSSNMGRNYDLLLPRMNALFDSISEEYKNEVMSFAEEICGGEHGLVEDGKISYEEAILLQMIPDALRGTACSALSLWGEKTVTGQNIMCRNLEWTLGSENQLCRYHAVVHMKKGQKRLTSITVLGLLNMLTSINNDGVFVAILDVGTDGENFVYEGKKCYTFELRKALENYTDARSTGNFMVENSSNFTFSHNIALADSNGTYCAEDASEALQKSGKGYSILRTASTPIFDGLKWDSPDSMCILNSYITQENQDFYSGNEANLVRFVKYNNLVNSQEKFSVADVKDLITQEVVEQKLVTNIHSKNVFHTVIVDYATGDIQVAFTGPEGVQDKPKFVSVGHY